MRALFGRAAGRKTGNARRLRATTSPGRRSCFAAATILLAALAGCATQTSQPLHLSQVGFDRLPGWQDANFAAAQASFRRGCDILKARPADAPMGGAGYGGTIADWLPACTVPDGAPRAFFESQFTPYAVVFDAGLFTGYYEPEIQARRSPQDAFQTPVHALPPDLIRADLGRFAPGLAGQHIAGRLNGQSLVPYPDRAAIDAGALAAAPVILYTDDPAALFFLQIQGSGRARLEDGSAVRLAYAGDNGQPYTAIGRTLIMEGALARENVSLQTIRAWLKAHPDQARRVMETDKSYVFFHETPLGDAALGSPGTLGANLTPLASLAVDSRIHPLGAPVYVAAEGGEPFAGLLIAQDTGGAIKGPVRGDIFFGFGAEAEQHAGNMKAEGKMFVLLPRALAQKLGSSWNAP